MIKQALGTLMLLMTSHMVFADSGTDMANTLASDLINAANGAANGTQAGNAESSLGVSASSIGGPSASQANDMGVSGSSESQFHFVLKPHCKVGITQHIISLDGTRISVSCQGVGQWVSLLLCTPNERINCNTQAQYQRISVPINGTDMHVGEYHLKALCKDGYCTGALSKTATITANSGNLDQKAQIAAQNNGVYQTVKTGYLGKNGYSKTQAYMHSFTSTGSNSSFAQCALGVKGYIASGVYYSCDGKAKDGFGAGCHSVTSCTQYSYHKHTDVTHKTCDITPGRKKIQCSKVPVVTIKTIPYVKPMHLNLTFKERGSNAGTFTSPVSGDITGISVGLGSYHAFHCNVTYVGKINGVVVGRSYTSCGEYNSGISFASSNLKIAIKGKSEVGLTFSGPVYRSWSSGGISVDINAKLTKKVVVVSWQQHCPEGM